MRRILIVLFFLLAIVLVGIAISGPTLGEQANTGNGQETAQVQRIDVDLIVSTTGTVSADKVANLGFGVSGTVEEVLVEAGDIVTTDQPMARLDAIALTLQVENAEQALAIARANRTRLTQPPTAAQVAQATTALENAIAQRNAAANARQNAPDQQMVTCMGVENARTAFNDATTAYDRYVRDGLNADPTFTANPDHPTALARDNAQRAFDQAEAQCRIATTNAQDTGQLGAAEAAVAQAQAAYDDLLDGPSETELAISDAQLRQAEIALEQAQNNLRNATISAPFDGVVTEVNLRLGQSVSPGAPVIVLTDLVPLHVDADVDELDVTRLTLDVPANVTLDAVETGDIVGRVSRIAPVGRVVQGVTTYAIQIDFDGDVPETMRAGMGGEVDIVVGQLQDALVVPTRSIQRNDATEFVLVPQPEGEPIEVPVISGQSVGEQTVVTPVTEGSLNEGDTVIVGRTRANIFQPPGGGR
ncbi:MAG: efflux RND transporter periplasmic adaptor subunit [Anaerolineae bacterium]|jgi:HlyD family secretion protein|nr:efflux RND transporter periplasmic adaptor subunit [Anaerolineae bacterium]